MALALDHYAKVIETDLGIDVRQMPGSGASGGLGTGLYALIGAKLYPRYEIVMKYLDLDRLLPESDLVITAEGCLDYQTPLGKIPAEVASRAKMYDLPVIALAGSLGKGAEVNWQHGIDYFTSIIDRPCQLSEAIADAANLLTNSAEAMARLMLVGRQVGVNGDARREARKSKRPPEDTVEGAELYDSVTTKEQSNTRRFQTRIANE